MLPEISVVIPMRNESLSVAELYRELTTVLEGFGRPYEIIAIDGNRLGYLTEQASAELAEACSGWQQRRYGWSVPPDRISPVADVLAALQAVIEHYTSLGIDRCVFLLPTRGDAVTAVREIAGRVL